MLDFKLFFGAFIMPYQVQDTLLFKNVATGCIKIA